MIAPRRLPWRVRRPLRRARNALARLRLARELPRWRAIARTAPRRDELSVFYGVDRMPGPDEVVAGGQVKFALLAEELPNATRDFNVLYLGSSSLPPDARVLARLAARRGAAFVWNQNGVAYPGWYGDGWELVNRSFVPLLHGADHVVFQSEFCRLSSDRFCGARIGPSEVLHNPVDTRSFTPSARRPHRPLTLLLGGTQYQRYRVVTALEAVGLVRLERPDTRLILAGPLSFSPEGEAETAALVRRLDLEGGVELAGPYTRREAPELMRRADLLLHTKYNDPCPTVVVEAMASGLPVVHSASGGVPELVGAEAGVGIPAALDWERDHPPPAEALASAVLEVAERLEEHAEAARRRAVERFDSRQWVARHRQLFEELRR